MQKFALQNGSDLIGRKAVVDTMEDLMEYFYLIIIKYNINYHTLISRIDEFDWDFEKALTTQTKQAKKRGA